MGLYDPVCSLRVNCQRSRSIVFGFVIVNGHNIRNISANFFFDSIIVKKKKHKVFKIKVCWSFSRSNYTCTLFQG